MFAKNEKAPKRKPTLPFAHRILIGLALGMGAGLAPRAPGTAGSFVALLLWYALAQLPPWLQALTTVAFVALAIYAAQVAGRHFGHHDDQRIVVDEWAGILVTLFLVPPGLATMAAGFVLFRLFDITKPWPARHFDRKVHNGFGNVMDDVCAGIYARLALLVLARFLP